MIRRQSLSPYGLLIWSSLAIAVLACDMAAQAAPASAPWYRRSRALELTGTNPRDSIVLAAAGTRADSLSISMTFYIAGAVVHRQAWTSDDELYDVDSLKTAPTKLAAYMRTRLDEILRGVKREPINREQVEHMGDEAALRRIVPSPTHQIMLSFGFENSLFFVWDAGRRRMVLFMECC